MAKFIETVQVINEAIEANRSKEPYKTLFRASENLVGDQRVGVEIYKDDPSQPHDFYTLKIVEGSFQVVEHGKSDPEMVWKVSEDYLNEVRNNPEKYKKNPEKLDFDWLKDRVKSLVG